METANLSKSRCGCTILCIISELIYYCTTTKNRRPPPRRRPFFVDGRFNQGQYPITQAHRIVPPHPLVARPAESLARLDQLPRYLFDRGDLKQFDYRRRRRGGHINDERTT